MRVVYNLSEEFSIKLAIHQGCCMSILLFITVLEAISQEFRTGCPWKTVCRWPGQLMEGLKRSWSSGRPTWNEMGFWSTWTKQRPSYLGQGSMCFRILQRPLFCLSLKAASTNSIFCGGCSSCIYKKCSGIPGPLKAGASFRCKRCTTQARQIDQTNGRGRSGLGEAWGGAILLIPSRLLILRWRSSLPAHIP